MYIFGWGQPVNRYKAYDYFCRAHSAGCAAGSHNRAVCKRIGYGCKQYEQESVALMKALAESTALSLKLMALVGLLVGPIFLKLLQLTVLPL
jgi:hypothetical protein